VHAVVFFSGKKLTSRKQKLKGWNAFLTARLKLKRKILVTLQCNVKQSLKQICLMHLVTGESGALDGKVLAVCSLFIFHVCGFDNVSL